MTKLQPKHEKQNTLKSATCQKRTNTNIILQVTQKEKIHQRGKDLKQKKYDLLLKPGSHIADKEPALQPALFIRAHKQQHNPLVQ
jgi:hypothetical protein